LNRFKDNIAIPGNEIFSTREIIPGKHFLPIHNTVFENILSIIMINKFHNSSEPIHERFRGSSSEDYNLATSTDCGRMIEMLVGNSDTGQKGFQLPPEFDFIHNEAVSPFQMMIIPFEHVLDKQDLINIYQGIMPDVSMRAEKLASAIHVQPNVTVDTEEIIPKIRYTPFHSIVKSEVQNVDIDLTHGERMVDFGLANFLNPSPAMASTVTSFITRNTSIPPDMVSVGGGMNSSKEFYDNLNFMVFKIKQKASSDFKSYRQRSVTKAIKSKFQEELATNPGVISNDLTRNIKNTEVYGANWPYDYFSLIEAIKLDIEFEVSK